LWREWCRWFVYHNRERSTESRRNGRRVSLNFDSYCQHQENSKLTHYRRSAMNEKLREAWRKFISAEDYDAHMAAMGQAEANARLVTEYFAAVAPEAGAKVLFLGAGTGQMFDFVSPAFLAPYHTTFADINPAYLQRLSERLASLPEIGYVTVRDDIEESVLQPGFGLVIAVLVLEHVDWRKAVATACRLTDPSILVINQENPESLRASMTPHREVPGTMNLLRDIHHDLIPVAQLREEFRLRGFALSYRAERVVADAKKMIASGSEKRV
jgi:hypothetical protein